MRLVRPLVAEEDRRRNSRLLVLVVYQVRYSDTPAIYSLQSKLQVASVRIDGTGPLFPRADISTVPKGQGE